MATRSNGQRARLRECLHLATGQMWCLLNGPLCPEPADGLSRWVQLSHGRNALHTVSCHLDSSQGCSWPGGGTYSPVATEGSCSLMLGHSPCSGTPAGRERKGIPVYWASPAARHLHGCYYGCLGVSQRGVCSSSHMGTLVRWLGQDSAGLRFQACLMWAVVIFPLDYTASMLFWEFCLCHSVT